jgi:hypothetical protein
MDWIREIYMLLQAAPTPEEESLFFRGIDADGNTVCREWEYEQTRSVTVVTTVAPPVQETSQLEELTRQVELLKSNLRRAQAIDSQRAQAFNACPMNTLLEEPAPPRRSVIQCSELWSEPPYGACKPEADSAGTTTTRSLYPVQSLQEDDSEALVGALLNLKEIGAHLGVQPAAPAQPNTADGPASASASSATAASSEQAPAAPTTTTSSAEQPSGNASSSASQEVMHLHAHVEAEAMERERVARLYEDEERRDEEGSGYGEGSSRTWGEPPESTPPKEPPPGKAC